MNKKMILMLLIIVGGLMQEAQGTSAEPKKKEFVVSPEMMELKEIALRFLPAGTSRALTKKETQEERVKREAEKIDSPVALKYKPYTTHIVNEWIKALLEKYQSERISNLRKALRKVHPDKIDLFISTEDEDFEASNPGQDLVLRTILGLTTTEYAAVLNNRFNELEKILSIRIKNPDGSDTTKLIKDATLDELTDEQKLILLPTDAPRRAPSGGAGAGARGGAREWTFLQKLQHIEKFKINPISDPDIASLLGDCTDMTFSDRTTKEAVFSNLRYMEILLILQEVTKKRIYKSTIIEANKSILASFILSQDFDVALINRVFQAYLTDEVQYLTKRQSMLSYFSRRLCSYPKLIEKLAERSNLDIIFYIYHELKRDKGIERDTNILRMLDQSIKDISTFIASEFFLKKKLSTESISPLESRAVW